jgi:hypothetical protein
MKKSDAVLLRDDGSFTNLDGAVLESMKLSKGDNLFLAKVTLEKVSSTDMQHPDGTRRDVTCQLIRARNSGAPGDQLDVGVVSMLAGFEDGANVVNGSGTLSLMAIDQVTDVDRQFRLECMYLPAEGQTKVRARGALVAVKLRTK